MHFFGEQSQFSTTNYYTHIDYIEKKIKKIIQYFRNDKVSIQYKR